MKNTILYIVLFAAVALVGGTLQATNAEEMRGGAPQPVGTAPTQESRGGAPFNPFNTPAGQQFFGGQEGAPTQSKGGGGQFMGGFHEPTMPGIGPWEIGQIEKAEAKAERAGYTRVAEILGNLLDEVAFDDEDENSEDGEEDFGFIEFDVEDVRGVQQLFFTSASELKAQLNVSEGTKKKDKAKKRFLQPVIKLIERTSKRMEREIKRIEREEQLRTEQERLMEEDEARRDAERNREMEERFRQDRERQQQFQGRPAPVQQFHDGQRFQPNQESVTPVQSGDRPVPADTGTTPTTQPAQGGGNIFNAWQEFLRTYTGR